MLPTPFGFNEIATRCRVSPHPPPEKSIFGMLTRSEMGKLQSLFLSKKKRRMMITGGEKKKGEPR
jgi:hypothetical protein